MAKRTTMTNQSTSAQTRRLVHFEFQSPAARKVCIAGTFNDWHPEVSEMISMGSGKWVKDLELTPGTYEYRFVVDGQWVTDPHCAHTAPNPFGETNSLLIVAKSKPTQKMTLTKPSRRAVAPRW